MTENDEPECGIDFCVECGDCLVCFGDGPCFETNDGKHVWFVNGREEKFDRNEDE